MLTRCGPGRRKLRENKASTGERSWRALLLPAPAWQLTTTATPVPGGLTPSTRPHGHCTHVVYIHTRMHAGKIPLHINNVFFKSTCYMDPLHEMSQIDKSKKTKRRSTTGKGRGDCQRVQDFCWGGEGD